MNNPILSSAFDPNALARFPNAASREVWQYPLDPIARLPENRLTKSVQLLSSVDGANFINNNPSAQICFENMAKVDTFFRTVFLESPVQRSDKLMKCCFNAPMIKDGQTIWNEWHHNAYWHPTCQEIAIGFFNQESLQLNYDTNLGVIAHEFGHAVTQYASGLGSLDAYSGQSGALNESMSDVFAIMVKHYQTHTLASSPDADWLIGEGCREAVPGNLGVGLRSMKNPKDNPYYKPAHMTDYRTWEADPLKKAQLQNDLGGVHIYCGIPNRAFYLTASAVADYTYGKPGQVWHQALMTAQPYDDFEIFAGRTLRACNDLRYHEGIFNAIGQAWQAVGVDLRDLKKHERFWWPLNSGSGAPLSRELIERHPHHRPIQRSEVFRFPRYDDRETIVRELEAGRQVTVTNDKASTNVYILREDQYICNWENGIMIEIQCLSIFEVAAGLFRMSTIN